MKGFLAATVLLVGCLLGSAPAFDDGPYLGVRFIEMPDKKVQVTYVDPRSLAWQIGLRENDIFLKVSGKDVKSTPEVRTALGKIEKKDGARFDLEVLRASTPGLGTQILITADLADLLMKADKRGKADKAGSRDDGPPNKGAKGDKSSAEGRRVETRRVVLKGVIRESTKRPGFFYATYSGDGDRGKYRVRPVDGAKKDR
jgi:hypothetical protein